MPEAINTLLHRHNPDIVVITGHDALLSEDKSRIYDISNYRNSSYFISATKECREYKPDLDSLVVIAGACQSFYEALIETELILLLHHHEKTYICLILLLLLQKLL